MPLFFLFPKAPPDSPDKPCCSSELPHLPMLYHPRRSRVLPFPNLPCIFPAYSALSLSDRSWTATNWYRYFWVGDHTLVGADVLGEVILIYRFWSLYEKNTRVIIIPCLATFGGLGNVPNPHHCSINHICTACIGVVVHFIFWPSPSLFINPFSPFPS